MYKLMMVDDEDTVRKRVINSIDFGEFGFELVCEAENGSEGYDMFLQHKPDVVITDIKMPFMDGLELSEKILHDFPYTKIIVLTGFDEFEYAKKSIDLHILKYILKPVSMNELVDILRETKTIIDEEIEERTSLERLKDHYDQSFPLMKQKFLEGLIHGEYTNETIEKWLVYYKVDLPGRHFVVSVVQIDDFYADKIVKRSSEIELRKIALLDMVEEISARYNLGAYFLYNDYVVIISGADVNRETDFLNEISSKLEKLRQAINRFQEFTVTIGIGFVTDDKTDLRSSYESAMNAQDYKISMGKNQVIYIKDMEPNHKRGLVFSELEETAIRRLLKTGTSQEYSDYLNKLFETAIGAQRTSSEMQVFIMEIVTLHLRVAKETGAYEMLEDGQISLQAVFAEFENVQLIKTTIEAYGLAVIYNLSNSRQDTTKSLVSDAKDYVKHNYMDFELTVEGVSGALHYSPNYFSTVFKKETGTSFLKYLLDIRLEKAKELLSTTDLKNFEVAVEVGFSSSNYFSYCFKKELGISPSQYKKSIR